MGRIERKTELTARIAAATSDGERATISEHTDFIREQLHDQSWTPWLPSTKRYKWGAIAVNPREDGSWETAEYEPRRLTRQP